MIGFWLKWNRDVIHWKPSDETRPGPNEVSVYFIITATDREKEFSGIEYRIILIVSQWNQESQFGELTPRQRQTINSPLILGFTRRLNKF